jgi:hypothetical protein
MAKHSSNCSNCRYSQVLPREDNALQIVCAKSPPIHVSVLVPTPTGPKWHGYTGWPVVEREYWCGEWTSELNS